MCIPEGLSMRERTAAVVVVVVVAAVVVAVAVAVVAEKVCFPCLPLIPPLAVPAVPGGDKDKAADEVSIFMSM